ncbi:MAG: calcium-transporting P-type ATPase, PMR1-type [Dehalococcoidia bacterium]|nr:calcium-transporting P-type ATPase, PMR1-type [Dehalococcoidia bacterium]
MEVYLNMDYAWHTLTVEEGLSRLDTQLQGLTTIEAQERLARLGPNALQAKKRQPPVILFLEQFKSFLIIILLFAVVASAILGNTLEAALILVIVVFAAGLGFAQEYRAERAIEALARMAAPSATVIRDGKEQEIDAQKLVPGDVLVLLTGDRVPADLRLMEAANLRADEASLTGESVPVGKAVTALSSGDHPVAERNNMAFMGTSVVYGRGRGVVVATGMQTHFGQIAGMLQTVETRQTPLQQSLDRLGRWIGVAAFSIVGVVFGLGLMRGEDVLEMFIWAVSLAVAAVPEALPAVVTISLALGVQRMVKRHALVRRLSAVETLGSTTIICSDKTGTLTQDQMTVRQLYFNGATAEVTGTGYEPQGQFLREGQPVSAGDAHLGMLLRIGALCNDSSLRQDNDSWTVRGDPTEGALVVVAAKYGVDPEALRDEWVRTDEVPFSSESRRMTTVHASPEGRIAMSKGATEVILDACFHIYEDGEVRPLETAGQEAILSVNQDMARNALRVLALAYKPLNGDERVGEGLVFAGLVGMMDPPRQEAKAAIAQCDTAGIKSVMITGDHQLTASAIARELGLLKNGAVLSGNEIERMTDEELIEAVQRTEVYARVSPAHKFRIVSALTQQGHLVAMTGDGVNDAPALKKADIGVAMGITGTDVSKEASEMILTDDNFASIVAAVEEGRTIFANIRKFLMYMFSTNLGELLLVLVAVLLNFPLPLTAIQLLFINLVTDGLPALALAVDPSDPDIMQRPPRDARKPVLEPPDLALVALGGAWSGLVNLYLFIGALNGGRGLLEAQALTFLCLVLIQYFKAFNFRSDRLSILRIGPFANRWLVRAVLLNSLLMLPVVYIPFLQGPFHTFSLGLMDWALVMGLAFTVVPVLEAGKWLRRRSAGP